MGPTVVSVVGGGTVVLVVDVVDDVDDVVVEVLGSTVVDVVDEVVVLVGAGADRSADCWRAAGAGAVCGGTATGAVVAGASSALTGDDAPRVRCAVASAATAPRFRIATTVTAERSRSVRLRRAGTASTLPRTSRSEPAGVP